MWGVTGTQGSAAKRVATLGCAPEPLRGKDKHESLLQNPVKCPDILAGITKKPNRMQARRLRYGASKEVLQEALDYC